MPHLDSRTQRHRNPRLIEQREYATGRLVGSFVWLGTGLAVWAFGYAFSAEFAWRQWPLVQGVGYVSGAVLVVRGLAGAIAWAPLAFQAVEPDEMLSRTYHEADPQPSRLVQHDENVTMVVDPNTWQAGEFPIVAARLRRAGWSWSREIINGGFSEPSLVNITGRYRAITRELERVGVIERDGRGWRVTERGRVYFSPTPNGEPHQTV